MGGLRCDNPASSASWLTGMDLDLTSLATQSLAADATYTINGNANWRKRNSANDATALALTNGQGLVITPAASTDLNGITFSLPLMQLPITSQIGAILGHTPLMIWAQLASLNDLANYDAGVFGIDVYNPAYNNQMSYAAKRGYSPSGRGWSLDSSHTQVTDQAYTDYNTGDVGVRYLPGGVFGGQCSLLVGTYAAGWPARSSLVMVASAATGTNKVGASAATPQPVASAAVVFGAQRSGSLTALVAKWAHARIDYLPVGG